MKLNCLCCRSTPRNFATYVLLFPPKPAPLCQPHRCSCRRFSFSDRNTASTASCRMWKREPYVSRRCTNTRRSKSTRTLYILNSRCALFLWSQLILFLRMSIQNFTKAAMLLVFSDIRRGFRDKAGVLIVY